MIDAGINQRHRQRNRLETLALIAFAIAIVTLAASGVVGLFALALVPVLILAARLAPDSEPVSQTLQRLGARPLAPEFAPDLAETVAELSRRAGLDHVPRLYLVPQSVMNAFAIGAREASVIGVTPPLLRNLTRREATGVMAHEIAHLVHGDIKVFLLGERLSRLASGLSAAGLIIFVFNAPALLAGRPLVPFWANILMLMAPGLILTLRLALSRTREFDADRQAAFLTGDPGALAEALKRLDQVRKSRWKRLFPNRDPQGSRAGTHPPTILRIRRLQALAKRGVTFTPFIHDGHRPFVVGDITPAKVRAGVI